jgi:hypothetical protein
VVVDRPDFEVVLAHPASDHALVLAHLS